MTVFNNDNQAFNGSSLYGNFRTRTLTEIFDSAEAFKDAWDETVFANSVELIDIYLVYYLLYGRYGNSNIASSDENQFKYKLFSTIFMYGPSWQRRLEIQRNLRALSETDITVGATAIYNAAMNPETSPSTQTLEELSYINSQNVTKHKKSKLEAYGLLNSLIETDVTEEFIGKFKKLFITIVEPELPLWYTEEN